MEEAPGLVMEEAPGLAAGSAMSSLCQGKGPGKSPADAALAVTQDSSSGVHRPR
jgi:hypothetical protein